MTDDTFERDLRLVLRDLTPNDAPASLREAVAAVPRTHPAPRRAAQAANRKRLLAFAGIAAAFAIVAAGIALALSGSFRGNIAGPSPVAPATPIPSPEALWIRLTFAYADAATPGATADRTSAEVAAMRLGMAGIEYSLQLNPTGFSVAVPEARVAEAQSLMQTGRLDFAPLGSEGAAAGDVLDLVKHPALFGNDGLASAAIGSDQTGLPTLDLTLTPAAATDFAAYTAGHVGEFFAIALDGSVLSAPVIQSSIPNGKVQITGEGSSGFDPALANRLIVVVASGPMPRALVQLSAEPQVAPPGAVTPAPSAVPSPTATASPSEAASPGSTASPGPSPLAVTKASGLPGPIGQATHYAGGVFATVLDGDLNATLWSSTDGLAWRHADGVERLLGNLTGVPIVQAAPCGDGLLVLATHADGTARIVFTKDLVTANTTDFNGEGASSVVGVAGGADGAIAWTEGGKVFVAPSCKDLGSPSLVSTEAPVHVTGAGILKGRYVAVGWTGPEGSEVAAAWWSDDGRQWTPATVDNAVGNGFITAPVFGSHGALSVVAAPGATGGTSRFAGTTDGTAWASTQSPLGEVTGEAGAGSDAGLLAGDGSRLLAYGAPGDNAAGARQFWLSDGSGVWRKAAMTGSKADLAALNAGGLVYVLPEGLLLAGDNETYVAQGSLP
ncbi:MAG: hypothetical protein U0838_16145 [Chloroflexota bacterium]